ncbi:hypothetical protein [Pseudogracilibacillus sp. SO30301A]|uniref:hypothetical protein n=1 Tax=Pseudogracilibacillus sp. SO30301A TaxID=3098291 RepID=UPI00300DF8B0
MYEIDIDKDFEKEMNRTKTRVKTGCLSFLIGFVALFFGLIIYFIGTLFFEMNFKENTLVVSESPKNINTIKVVEIGAPFSFGSSSIRLKYKDDDFDTSLSNDGKNLDESNIEINWINDKEATVIFDGEEQPPEVIKFKVTDNESASFKVEYIELGYIPTTSQQDPNGDYAIQIRKSTYSKGSEKQYNYNAPIRVYYGPKGSEPVQFKDWKIDKFSNKDKFELYWQNDYVLIDVLSENDNGTIYVKDSLKLSFN